MQGQKQLDIVGQGYFLTVCIDLIMTGVFGRFSKTEFFRSCGVETILSTTSIPSSTFPKTA
jgi:hypothetical protein